MSRTVSFRSTLFVWGLLSVTAVVFMAFSRGTAMSAEKAINDVELKSYLPFVTNIGISEFDAPLLVSPENNAVLQTLIPTFIWDMGTHPPNTIVWSCLTFSPSETQIDGCWSSGGAPSGIDQTTAWFNFEPDTVYFWRVGFIYDGNYDDKHWSETRKFTTGPSGGVILPPPILESPADGSAISVDAAILDWADVAGSVMYSVLIHDVNPDRYYGWDISESQLNVSEGNWWTVEPGGIYEWSVSVRNDYAWSDESETRTFSVLPSSGRSSGNGSTWPTVLRTKNGFTHVYGR